MTKPSAPLLPCPFCGSTSISEPQEGSTFRWRYLACNECGAQCGEERIQTLGDGTNEEWDANVYARLIESWNRRASPQVPPRDDPLPALKVSRELSPEIYVSSDGVVFADPDKAQSYCGSHGQTFQRYVADDSDVDWSDASPPRAAGTDKGNDDAES